jgi:hypothetical protein
MRQYSKKTKSFLNWNSNPSLAWVIDYRKKPKYKKSRITKDTFRKKSKDVFIEAKIQDHLEKVIENPNPKKHQNPTMEMILGRKQNENAYIRQASWC